MSRRVTASTTLKTGDFRCYSNTSDDALGLSGAFADIGSALSQAEKAILITSWTLSPGLHLPFFHEDLRIALQSHQANNFYDDEEQNSVGAITQYKKIIQKFPENSTENIYAHYFLSVIALQEGRVADAERMLTICLTQQPNNPQFQNTQLYILYLQGKFEEASQTAELQADGVTDATFWTLYGDILSAKANKETSETEKAALLVKAEKNYKRALIENRECIPAMRGLGKLYYQQNKIDDAITQFKKILNYFPTDLIANQNLAEIAYNQNRFDDAINYSINALRGGHKNAAILNGYALSYCKKHFSDSAISSQTLNNCLALIDQALEKDQANFLLNYYKSFVLLKQNNNASAKKSLEICVKIDPAKLQAQLGIDTWSAEFTTDLNLENKMRVFSLEFPPENSLDEKIAACNAYIEQFPFAKEGYFKLAELYEQSGNYASALEYFCKAGDLEACDIGYLQTIIQRLESLSLDQGEEIKARLEYIAGLRGFIKKFHGHFDFYDAYAQFREQLPTLGELLVQKARDNPEMVVALQLWNRSSPGDRNYADIITEEFTAIARKLGLTELPPNLLLRFTNTDSVGYTHHQKYIVVDTGAEHPTAFYGSCDLAFGKFDWSDHSLVNTVNNGGAVSRAHGFNHAENIRRVNESKLSLPWREVISRAEGPIAVDFVSAFENRWRAKGHGTFSGVVRGPVGAKDQSRVTTYAVNLQTAQLGYEASGESDEVLSPALFSFDRQSRQSDRDYPWQAQLLQSTKKSYAPDNPGFFKATTDHESSIQHAMIDAISKAENYVYIETQYFTDPKIADALAKRIQEKHAKNEPFHVYTVLPFSPNGDPGGRMYVEPIRELQWELMQRCMQSVEDRTGKPWNTYLSFMFFAQWEGVSEQRAQLQSDGQAHTRTELLNESYRQPVYIHSKLMVIDDQTIINGSANLNERSLSGSGDTEIAVIQSPKPGHEAECRAVVSEFMREKIVRPYFGEDTIRVLDGNAVTLDVKPTISTPPAPLNLGSQVVSEHIQRVSVMNYRSFASNEPGHTSSPEQGKAVAFPLKMGVCGRVGELRRGCETIPDAPIGADGKSNSIWSWIPEKARSLVLRTAEFFGYKGLH